MKAKRFQTRQICVRNHPCGQAHDYDTQNARLKPLASMLQRTQSRCQQGWSARRPVGPGRALRGSASRILLGCGSARYLAQFWADLVAADLGVANSGLDRGGSGLGEMAQAVGDLFQTPAGGTRPMGKI